MATTWEYATIPLIIHATKAILDQWGADGWELVQVIQGPDADLARGRQRAGDEGQLPGGVDVGAGPDSGHVGRKRQRHLGQLQPEVSEPGGGPHQDSLGRLR